MENRGDLGLIFCNSCQYFGQKVFHQLNKIKTLGEDLKINIIPTEEIHFANTEVKTVINDSIRGHDVYVFQDTENNSNHLSVDQNFRALLTAVEAAWRSDAHYVTAILPSFPYARQDRSVSRESITAAKIAEIIENAGADRVITLDVHNEAIAGAFRKAKFENLHASKNLLEFFQKNVPFDNSHLMVMAPDTGAVERASHFAAKLQAELGIIYKRRDYSQKNKVKETRLLGEVKGKDILLVDDMIDTAGTAIKVIELLKSKGANKICFACSLPLFNGPAAGRLGKLYNEGKLQAVVGTDAVHHSDEFKQQNPWYLEVSLAKYFARVIYNINHYQSISKLLR